jgi:Holliday junction DNA helicase RuvB subunit
MGIFTKKPVIKPEEAEVYHEDFGNGLYRPQDAPQRFICKIAEDQYILSSAYPMKQSEVRDFDSLNSALSYCHFHLKNSSEGSGALLGSNEFRPLALNDFIGQDKLKQMLNMNIAACKNGELMPHCLFAGNAGLGKTTLAQILAHELGVKCHAITAPAIRSRQGLVKIILQIKNGDILFIDEIHRLRSDIEELLYPVMEDFKLDLAVGYGETRQLKQINLPKFTLIGATTIAGKINKPLRDRFKEHLIVQFYEKDELATVVMRNSIKCNCKLDKEAALEVAMRARGTPRVANNLMEYVIRFARGKGCYSQRRCGHDSGGYRAILA